MGNTDSAQSFEEPNPTVSRGRRNTGVAQPSRQQKAAAFKTKGRSQSLACSEYSREKEEENSLSAGKRKGSLPHLTCLRIHKCFKQSRPDLGKRIFERASLQRAEFRDFVARIGEENVSQACNTLHIYLQNVVERIEDNNVVTQLSEEYGTTFVPLTAFGFKADFFAVIAKCMTAECVLLDGGQHHTSDTFLAWSNLTAIMFSSVRDGFYSSLRRQRKTSLSVASRQNSADLPSASTSKRMAAFRQRKTMSLDIS